MTKSSGITSLLLLLSIGLALGVPAAHGQPLAEPSPDCTSSGSPAVRAGNGGDTRELRLGLVFYGGVSLAVYMHGQTKEVHNLVIASRAHEAGLPRDEVAERFGGTVLAYYDALADLEREAEVKTRVIVDSIAGTSAGGINGVFLAKALAHDQSEDGLRDLWMEKADIWKLMGGRFEAVFRLLRLAGGLVIPKVRAEPPLDGDLMYRWVYEALEEMGTPCPGESLVPPGERLRLFVTTTDFRGRPRGFVIGDPATGREKQHRVVFDLELERGADGSVPIGDDDPFGREDNPLLAFAARSTSSFPGAFPPIHLADMRKNLCDERRIAEGTCPVSDEYVQGLRERVFPEYALDGSKVDDSWFVDGGVLDNYPFGHVIDDLTSRAPAREVDRRLVYFQPDPADPPGPPDPEELRFLQTVWGALSTIVGSEPTGDDFGEIEQFNQRVQLAGGIIDRVRDEHARDVDALLDLRSAKPVDPAQARNAIDAKLRRDAGMPYAAYQELRTLAVVQQLERNASRACRLEESIQRSMLTAAIRRWAEERGLIGHRADPYAQEWLRERLDVGYLWRQLRFVGESVNGYYHDLSTDDQRLRAELDEAQAALALRTDETRRLMAGQDLSDGMKAEIGKLCAAALAENDVDRGFDAAVRRFLEAHRGTMDALYDAATAHIGDRQKTIRAELQGDYDRITADWPEDWRLGVYRDYLGFALWDLVLYPYQRLTDAGEFQQVRVVRMAPDDARALGVGRASDKLGGASLGHFGAFFERKRREKDYLWGRFDGAERILSLLYGLREEGSDDAVAPVPPERLRTAFLGVVEQEREALPLARECMDAVEARLADPAALGANEPEIPTACRAD